ncbi:hypothetical protein ABPG74_022677 [Tetrahymena malaccensis]
MDSRQCLTALFVLINFSIIKEVVAGTILQGTTPIYNTIANNNQYADYTFQIIPQSSIPAGGQVIITFPYQYAPGLGIPAVTNTTCNMRCDIFDQKVFFYFDSEDILSNIQLNLTIYQVLNPLNAGGTGNFYVETVRGQNYYDSNLMFGSLGVAGSIAQLASTTIAVDSSGTTAAGQPSKYNFAFKTATFIPQNSYIELWIPNSGFSISQNPSCSTYPINGVQIQGQIQCTLEPGSTIIQVQGKFKLNIILDINIGSDVGISVTMTNPTISIFTGNFRIVVYRANTKVVLAWSNYLKGLQITPGQMQYLKFQPVQSLVVQAQQKVIDYTLTFLPKNPLLSGSIIQISLPSDGSIKLFDNNSDFTSSYQLLYGLNDISPDNPLDDSDITNNYIRFKNFSPQTSPSEISVFMRLILPGLSGNSNSIVVTTYTSSQMTTIIDQDSTSAFITVQPYNSYNAAILVQNQNSNKYQANTSDSPSSPTKIYFTPPSPIPAGSIYRLIFPSQFSLSSVSASKCQVNTITSNICKRKDQVVTMFSSTASGSTVINGVQGTLQFSGFITTPVYQGAYLVDLTIYDSTQTNVLFTFSILLIITPQPLSSISNYVYMNYLNYAPAAATDYIRHGILEITLTTASLIIPQGMPSNLSTDPQGFIDILFISNYDQTLGSNVQFGQEFYCKAIDGLFSLQGQNIKCYLIKKTYADPTTSSPPATYTAIRMKYFQSIAPNSFIRFHIPNILNPLSTPAQVLVLLKQLSNRREQILNTSGYLSVNYATYPQGAVTNLQNDNYILFNPKTVFDITSTNQYYLEQSFDIKIALSATVPSYNLGDYIILILPTFDTGFIPSDDSISVGIIENASYYTQQTILYHAINWILIKITSVNPATNQLISTNNLYIYIRNLVYPRYAQIFGTIIQIPVYQNPTTQSNIQAISRNSNSLPVINDFTDIQIQVPFKAAYQPGSRFEFYIIPQNDLLDGFSVQITFDSQFNLQMSFPSPSFSAPQLNPLTSQGLIYNVQNNVFTISNIKSHPAGSPFRIVVDGVKNPASISQQTTGWSVVAYYQNQNNFINQRNAFNGYTTGTAFQSGLVIFQGINAFPSNSYLFATYTVSFTPSSSFKAFAIIQITFPISSFSNLPTNPICSVSGGLQTFKSCSVSGNTFILVTETDYNSDTINFSVQNIQNPSPGQTDGFVVQIYYDGVLLQDTDTTTLNLRTLQIQNRATPIQIQQMTFSPINEAQNGQYTFILIPTNSLTSSSLIYIKFPSQYDNLLGQNINCQSQGGLTSEIGCSVSQGVITINGITSYTPSFDNPIVLVITGIMNPNELQDRNGGSFQIGIYALFTNFFVDFNGNAGNLRTTAAPSWLQLQSMNPSNYYIRRSSTYYMQFIIDPSYPLPSSNSLGQILIEYPSQYDVPNWQVLSCTSTNVIMNNINCSVNNNIVTVTGNQVKLSGLTDLYINNFLNPTNPGSTNPIIIKAFDGFNNNIISQTFFNIDPSFFTFKIPGPYISVNANQTIIVERGTQSKDLQVSLVYPCALNLTLIPQVSQQGITVIPSQLPLLLGNLTSTFRVSVDQGVNGGNQKIDIFLVKFVLFYLGNYYIYWSIQGEQNPPLYTPMQKTQVQVTANKNIRINVGTLQEIPLGGWSLPTVISTDYAPNLSLEILILFQQDYQGVTISQKSLLLSQGVNSVSFYLNCTTDTTVQSGTLQLSLDGINSDVYTLSQTTLNFVIIGQDTNPPQITDFSNTTTTQTTATITIGTSEVTQAFLMIALQGTDAPSINDLLIQKKPKWKSTRTMYGSVVIGNTNQATYIFTGLQAQVYYTCFAFAVDRGGQWSGLKQFDFQTSNRYVAADFALTFNQAYLNSAEKRNIINGVAFVLSLMQAQVIERKYVFTTTSSSSQTSSRVLSDQGSFVKERIMQTQQTSIHLQIISNPFTENFPSPYNLVGYLIQNQLNNLANILTNLNTTAPIPYSNFPVYVPNFLITPTEIDTATNKVTISVELDNYGFVYAMATKTQEDKGKPNGQQIQWGYNSTNGIVPSWKIEISQPYTKYNLTIPSMIPNTEYNVYIIGGSVQPGYPDLMDNSMIQLISAQTLFIPSLPVLDLSNIMLKFAITQLILILLCL